MVGPTGPRTIGQRSRRLQWPFVITHCPASVVCLSSVRLFTFSTSSSELLNGFWWNLVWMKYSRSLMSVVAFSARFAGAAVAEWLSSWLAEQEDRGSIPGLATWIFRDWLSPASKSRYGWKIAKSTLIKNNQPTIGQIRPWADPGRGQNRSQGSPSSKNFFFRPEGFSNKLCKLCA